MVAAAPVIASQRTIAAVGIARSAEFLAPVRIIVALAGGVSTSARTFPAAVAKTAVSVLVSVLASIVAAIPIARLPAIAPVAAFPHLVLATATFGILIAEPGGDFVSSPLKEAAVVPSAARSEE